MLIIQNFVDYAPYLVFQFYYLFLLLHHEFEAYYSLSTIQRKPTKHIQSLKPMQKYKIAHPKLQKILLSM